MSSTILGIIASSGAAAGAATSYESIATVPVGAGGSASVSFTSIPSTYTHLQIRGIARTTASLSDGDYATIRLNSDSSSNYASHQLVGTGSAVNIVIAVPATEGYIQRFGTATQSSNVFGANVLDILDYKDTNKFKTLRFLGGMDGNGNGWLVFGSSLWRSTSAITSIVIAGGSGNFVQYSQFALYGIKGS